MPKHISVKSSPVKYLVNFGYIRNGKYGPFHYVPILIYIDSEYELTKKGKKYLYLMAMKLSSLFSDTNVPSMRIRISATNFNNSEAAMTIGSIVSDILSCYDKLTLFSYVSDTHDVVIIYTVRIDNGASGIVPLMLCTCAIIDLVIQNYKNNIMAVPHLKKSEPVYNLERILKLL